MSSSGSPTPSRSAASRSAPSSRSWRTTWPGRWLRITSPRRRTAPRSSSGNRACTTRTTSRHSAHATRGPRPAARMKPAPFTYHRPAEVDEAVRLLAELHDRDESAKVLAGGQSLVPLLSMRLAAPMHIVDVGALPDLADVAVDREGVSVGALVRHRGLERHEGAHAVLPLLRQALVNVAHPTIRNRGTVVGSLCHADPSAEMPAVLTLLGGALTVRSVRGERTVCADELFTGPLETSLADDELALAAHFPAPPP